jgi:hypothetical protein
MGQGISECITIEWQFPQANWSIRNSVGDVLGPGGNGVGIQSNYFSNRIFLLMFPPKQLTDMVRWTNIHLHESSMKETTPSEVLKFFGILILTTNLSSRQEHLCGIQRHGPSIDRHLSLG